MHERDSNISFLYAQNDIKVIASYAIRIKSATGGRVLGGPHMLWGTLEPYSEIRTQ